MIPDLAQFLLDRIFEDEAFARDWPDDPPPPPNGPLWVDAMGHPIYQPRARVLAECEAKRRIVELHVFVDGDGSPFCADDGEDFPCPTLRFLALPYADHPDYREVWRS